jgi:hypothetical protein
MSLARAQKLQYVKILDSTMYIIVLEGKSHEIFDPRFLSWVNTTWVTDQQV